MNEGIDKDELQNLKLISATLILSMTHISSLDILKDNH